MKCKNIDDKIQKNKQKANKKFRINNIKKQELKEQGVTMLSLVVTIVVLLILSGITIKFALNDNGVIKQSKLASEKYKNSTIQEQAALNEVAKQMSTASSSSGTSGGSGGSGGSSSDGNTDELMQQIEILQDQVDMLNNQIDDLKTKQATGNATTSQVLSGATFSTSAGIGLTGTMKNNGAWSANTTGSGNITIPEGYHNGKGYVSGAGAYNKGVSDADARVNTGSESYKQGFKNGGFTISQAFAVDLTTIGSHYVDTKDWLNEDIQLKGIIISIPQKDAYSFGGVAFYTKDANLLSLVKKTDWYAEDVHDGGVFYDPGRYFYQSYAVYPNWSLNGSRYEADRLPGAVNQQTILRCTVYFVY